MVHLSADSEANSIFAVTSPANAVQIETCGVHCPHRISEADALQQPAASAISESFTVESLGRIPPEQLRVVDRPGIALVPLRERPLAGLPGASCQELRGRLFSNDGALGAVEGTGRLTTTAGGVGVGMAGRFGIAATAIASIVIARVHAIQAPIPRRT
jgi:hypothetical protein